MHHEINSDCKNIVIPVNIYSTLAIAVYVSS